MKKVIGIKIDGQVDWHVNGGPQDYATICGIDPDDPSIGHTGTVPAPRGQKITCPSCRATWEVIRTLKLRQSDFE